MTQNWRLSIIVAAIAATVFLTALGSTRLFDEDEPKNAVCGHEMLDRGDWIVPTFNGDLRTDKPILLYWCMLISYHVFGVSEFAARLPSALAGIGTVLLTFQLGRMLFTARAGLLAGALLSSSLMFTVLARGATPDSLLIFCIAASLTAFVAGVTSRRGGNFSGIPDSRTGEAKPIRESGLPVASWIGMYAAMGLAVLAKGPIGVVMPVGIIGSYLLFFDGVEPAPPFAGRVRRLARFFAPRRFWEVMRTMKLVWGVLIVALVAVPWYAAVAIQTNGAWVSGFLGTHNVGRFMHPMEHHRGLPIYYLVAILIGFFPGSIFLPVGTWQVFATVRDRGSKRSSAAFLACWIGCYVGFFTLAATKLPNYVTPCYPALAVVSGVWLFGVVSRATKVDWRMRAGYSALAIGGLVAAVALGITAKILLHSDPLPALPGLVAVAGGIVCLAWLRRGGVRQSVVAFVVTCVAFTTSAMTYTAWRASRMEEGPLLAARIHQLPAVAAKHAPQVATFGYFTPSLVYYIGHSVTRLGRPDDFATFFESGGDALVMPRSAYDKNRSRMPHNVKVLAEENRFLRQHEPIVLVGRTTEIARGAQRDEQAR